MIQWVLLPFFALYLGLVVIFSLSKMVIYRFRKGVFLGGVVLVWIVLAGISWQWLHIPRQTSISTPDLSAYQQEYQVVLQELQQQPTHRDLLWNAAQLANVLGDSSASARFHQQLKLVDPNSPLLRQ